MSDKAPEIDPLKRGSSRGPDAKDLEEDLKPNWECCLKSLGEDEDGHIIYLLHSRHVAGRIRRWLKDNQARGYD
jgi:hypothetical protein